MNAQTGQWHLLRLRIRFSHTGGSSRGVRFHMHHLLDEWKKRNPQVAVQAQHSQFEHPQLYAEYRSGECQTICVRNMTASQLETMMNLLRNSESPNLFLKHGGPRVWTERRSIQGMWQPSYEGMAAALKWAHCRDRKRLRLKYSAFSLKLSQQAWKGEGRWGDEKVVKPINIMFMHSKSKFKYVPSVAPGLHLLPIYGVQPSSHCLNMLLLMQMSAKKVSMSVRQVPAHANGSASKLRKCKAWLV